MAIAHTPAFTEQYKNEQLTKEESGILFSELSKRMFYIQSMLSNLMYAQNIVLGNVLDVQIPSLPVPSTQLQANNMDREESETVTNIASAPPQSTLNRGSPASLPQASTNLTNLSQSSTATTYSNSSAINKFGIQASWGSSTAGNEKPPDDRQLNNAGYPRPAKG